MRRVTRLGAAAGVAMFAVASSLAAVDAPPATAATATTVATAVPNTTTTNPAPPATTATTVPTPGTTAPPTTTTGSPTTTTASPSGSDAGGDGSDPQAESPPPPAPGKPGVSLVSQTAWVPTRGAQVLALHLDEPGLAAVPDAEVELTIHRSVDSRTDFDNAISGAALPSERSQLTFPLADVAFNGRNEFLVGFGLSGSGASRRIGVDTAGVYPVEVGVVVPGSDRGTFLTWMVVVDPDVARSSQPLRMSWIWRLESRPLEPIGGGIDPAVLPALRPGGRLDRIATLMARAKDFPITAGIGPQTLSVWSNEARDRTVLAAGARRVRRAAARASTQLLPEPFVPIEGPTIEAEGLGEHVPDEYVAGSNSIEQTTGEIPDPRTAFVDPVDEATIVRRAQMLVGRFVVRDTALAPVAQPLTPAQPFTLTTSGGTTAAAVATDSGLERLVESAGPPALRVQRVLAALAEIAYEAPSLPRGVVLATPADWSPDVATMSLLLREVAHNPLVKPATLDALFSEVAPASTDGVALTRQLAPTTAPTTLPLREPEYDAAARELTAYESMVGRDDPSVAAGEHALLLALSTSNSRADALARLQTIATKLDALTSGITTTAKALTLTARRANLPLSFQNNTGRAGIRVLVHLESAKLVFPRGSDLVIALPLGHSTFTKEFPVEARASGNFTMTITLKSPDKLVAIGPPVRVAIRSAVFSGIGIALTLGALLFLAGWWGNHFWRTRRARRRARIA